GIEHSRVAHRADLLGNDVVQTGSRGSAVGPRIGEHAMHGERIAAAAVADDPRHRVPACQAIVVGRDSRVCHAPQVYNRRDVDEAKAPAAAWELVKACAQLTETLSPDGPTHYFAFDGALHAVAAADATVSWDPSGGWISHVAPEDARAHVLSLYLPVCSATRQ